MNHENMTDVRTARKQPSRGIASVLFDYVEIFVWALFAVMLVFTFAFRICRVDGESMKGTLENNERLLISNVFYTPKQDDIVVFHMTNEDAYNMEKTLVKRVIAVGGQEVVIDTNQCLIIVDGIEYTDDPFYRKYQAGETSAAVGYDTRSYLFPEGIVTETEPGIFRATVPEGCVFVMGDNRNNSKDSRNPDIGFVDERCILGKVILRFYPFTWLG